MSEREAFELTEVFKERCEGLIFNNGKYEFDKNIEGLSQMKMAILGLNLTVVNSAWYGWKASINREGYKFVTTAPTPKVYDRLFAEHDLEEDRVTYIYKDIMDASE